MVVRLSFAVAAHLDPEILIIDEALAVGDAAFQKKCIKKMGDVAKGERTVLLVSHNMGYISMLAERAILLECGIGQICRRDCARHFRIYGLCHDKKFQRPSRDIPAASPA